LNIRYTSIQGIEREREREREGERGSEMEIEVGEGGGRKTKEEPCILDAYRKRVWRGNHWLHSKFLNI